MTLFPSLSLSVLGHRGVPSPSPCQRGVSLPTSAGPWQRLSSNISRDLRSKTEWLRGIVSSPGWRGRLGESCGPQSATLMATRWRTRVSTQVQVVPAATGRAGASPPLRHYIKHPLRSCSPPRRCPTRSVPKFPSGPVMRRSPFCHVARLASTYKKKEVKRTFCGDARNRFLNS